MKINVERSVHQQVTVTCTKDNTYAIKKKEEYVPIARTMNNVKNNSQIANSCVVLLILSMRQIKSVENAEEWMIKLLVKRITPIRCAKVIPTNIPTLV